MTDLDDYKQWKKVKGYDDDFSHELTIYTKQAYLDACEAKGAVIDRITWELNKANELHESAASKLWDAEQDLKTLRLFADSVLFPPRDQKTMSLALSLGLINQSGLRTKVLSGE